jgi:hypothetical protein
MTRDDLMIWLGPEGRPALTADQVDRLREESDRIDVRYPDPDEIDLWTAAMSAAMQYILGEVDPDDAGRILTATRTRMALELAASRQLAVMLRADGSNRSAAARRTGIDRMTLLKDLGER